MSAPYAEFLLAISVTIIDPERTCRWGKTRRSHARSNGQKSGPVVAISQVGGLHHRYERPAA